MRAGLEADDVLPGAQMVSVRQVHSADVAVVDGAWSPDGVPSPEADALVTDRPGLLRTIATADCAPVLLADRAAGVIGAAHAGWRGAKDGVVEACVAAMEGLGARAERIAAAIGPCIAQASYEVDDAMRACFAAEDRGFFDPGSPGHWQFDLEGYVAERLARSGVARIDRLGCDTYGDPVRFFSFRRATHRGEPHGGRQVSVIGLPAAG